MYADGCQVSRFVKVFAKNDREIIDRRMTYLEQFLVLFRADLERRYYIVQSVISFYEQTDCKRHKYSLLFIVQVA